MNANSFFSGIVGTDGKRWREGRKFSTAIFRKLGAGKSVMEDWIYVS